MTTLILLLLLLGLLLVVGEQIKMMAEKTITEIFSRESDRITREINEAISEGFEFWHWWDDFIESGDKVRQFGFLTLVKRHLGPRSNKYPANMGKIL